MTQLISEEQFYALVELTYFAALSPKEWQTFLNQFVATIPGTAAAILIRSLGAESGLQVMEANFPKGAMEEYLKNHAETAPWSSILRHVEPSKPFVIEDYMPMSAIKGTGFYNDFVVRFGIYGSIGVKLWDRLDGRATFFVSCSEEKAAALRPGLISVLARLAPHLERALSLRWALRRQRLSGLEEGLARQLDPMFVLNDRGEVLHMNHAATQMRDAGHVRVDAVNRQLQLPVRKDFTALQALIKKRGASRNDGQMFRQIMTFSLPNLIGPNVLELLGLPDAALAGPDSLFSDSIKEPYSLVTVRLRSGFRRPSAEDIRAVLGLSPRETDVALGVSEGYTPEELSRQLDVTVDTVRWHLKNIYQRVGCSSQSELVSVIFSLFGPAHLV